MLSQNHDYKYRTITIDLPVDFKYTNYNFREIDGCFIHNKILYIIECKDNLYLDLFDNPDLCLKWVLENLRRLKFKQKMCYKIREQIALDFGIEFTDVIPILLSNIDVPINNCYTFSNFKQFLQDLLKDHTMDSLTRNYENYLISRMNNFHQYSKKTDEMKTKIQLYFYYKVFNPNKAKKFIASIKDELKQSAIYSIDLWKKIFP